MNSAVDIKNVLASALEWGAEDILFIEDEYPWAWKEVAPGRRDERTFQHAHRLDRESLVELMLNLTASEHLFECISNGKVRGESHIAARELPGYGVQYFVLDKSHIAKGASSLQLWVSLNPHTHPAVAA